MKSRPIGIFDSGVGGLTVLRQIQNIIPREDIIYFGDTARVPYGNKSKQTVIKFSTENAHFLAKRKVKMIVVACNTSSSFSLEHLRGIFNIPIVGVIEAGVSMALQVSHSMRIGVIGTKSTIASESYQKEIRRMNRSAKLYSSSCPLFVPLVEEGILHGKVVSEAIKMYLRDFKTRKIDTLILGCTHYPLLKPEIANYLKGITIVDSANAVAQYTKSILTEQRLLNDQKKQAREEFYVSDEPEGFKRLAKLFLKRKIPNPELTNA